MSADFAFLEELAEAAARETLSRFRQPIDVANKETGGFDPVTEADRAAETAIRDLIGERFPEDGILGEEHGSASADSARLWVIDPIDGTRAFISGLPVWGTLVGLYEDGRAVLGMMDQPFTGERFLAGGEGAVLRTASGERPLAVRDCETLSRATLFTTSPKLHTGANAERYERLEQVVRLPRYGCDCYAFALLAAGHVDLVVESGLKPYDIAGLIPLVERAGGVVTTWTGGRPEQGGDIVAAGSAAVHEAALAVLGD
ncbi:histidinol-phosphatase [Pararhizobium mangrovi]|uniref:Histidinol-phosphatase n=1 Tax=Pararhizobium mangrovi TaxID=2590452 RepID=A0A506UBE0_9HYPH|nr:histidinol-phosphatase [Pararhizobium mangrovi]TPW29949.1 histidinol-phosphatase [Pararhizobium mangrovi]